MASEDALKMFSLTCSSGNFGTVTFSIIARDEASAIAIANQTGFGYPTLKKKTDFYKLDSAPIEDGAVLYSENNE